MTPLQSTEVLNRIDSDQLFDALVVGAGPAGASVSNLLARRGYSVLLVEKQSFPRDKVCGSCLSGRAIKALRRLGLISSIKDSVPLKEFVLATRGRQVRLACEGGYAISRRNFDSQMVSLAVDAGVQFLPNVRATPAESHNDWHQINLVVGRDVISVRSRLVLVCAGLGKAGGNAWGLTERVSAGSKIGLTSYCQSSEGYEHGSIFMCVGRSGYLGLTAMEDGRLNLSACVNRGQLANSSPADVANALIRQAGLPMPALTGKERWTGTPFLSRRLTCPGKHRLLVLGDAAAYVEPFTGEGMAWALEAAEDIEDIAVCAIESWDEAIIRRWQKQSKLRQQRQHRTCKRMKWFAKHPLVVTGVVRLLNYFPRLASPVLRSIHQT